MHVNAVLTSHARANVGDSTDNVQLTQRREVESSLLPIDSAENSIFNQPVFPHATNKITCTPADVRNMLHDYADSIDTIDVLLQKHGIRLGTFYRTLLTQYDEIRQMYLSAQKLKAARYGDAAKKLWDAIPDNPVFYVHDRDGHKSLSNAAVQYLRVKSDAMLRFAQIHETGSFVPASKQESVTRNFNVGVNLTGKLPADIDISTPDAILGALKSRGKS